MIEDERTLAASIEQSLRADGYAVTVCDDGPSGEAAALTGDYALVLLDPTLPGKDGLEVPRTIRAGLPDLPVVALLGATDEADPIETVRNVGYRLRAPCLGACLELMRPGIRSPYVGENPCSAAGNHASDSPLPP